MSNETTESTTVLTQKLTTFSLGSDQFGIDVMKVQEVANSTQLTRVPLSPNYVKGIINLRGQIVPAIGLNELLGIKSDTTNASQMMVVCRADGHLVSLIVDSIGDVVEIPNSKFENPPDTLQLQLRKYLSGVFKTEGMLLGVIDIEKLMFEINKAADAKNIEV